MMHLKNYMEDLVWQHLEDVLANNPEICTCEKCRYDIVSLALNTLPPRYVVTETGETYTRVKMLEHQFNIDIITAISQAIKVVQCNPRHDANRS